MSETQNTESTATTENISCVAKDIAKQAVANLPKIKSRKNKEKKRYESYALKFFVVASQAQVESDKRLAIIKEFILATRVSRGRKPSVRREFIIDALYKGILSLSKKSVDLGNK